MSSVGSRSDYGSGSDDPPQEDCNSNVHDPRFVVHFISLLY